MKPGATGLGIAAAILALALISFIQFPGHTYLQQDTQIYVPILEHLRDPSVLRNDILAQKPHVAFTLYDEAARVLRAVTGVGFREVLQAQQIAARAFGIWGLYLMAAAVGLSAWPALAVAGICSLGVSIAGPAVLTVEYEPSPRAIALPVMICAIGLAAHRRYLAAGIAGAIAFLYHPPTALPFWGVFLLLVVMGRDRKGALAAMAPLLAAVAILLISARAQAAGGEAQPFFSRLTPQSEQLQRLRTAYVWISTWPAARILHWIILFGIVLAAFARLRRRIPSELAVFALGLPMLGIASMPLSWLLLDHWKWALLPQLQPLRGLLFVALMTQFLAAVCGAWAATDRRPFEAIAWFALAYLLPLQTEVTENLVWSRIALAVALGSGAALASRWAPVAVLAAFFVIPAIGHVVNYPHLHTPELADLSAWARSTPRDAVFLFPTSGRSLDPGIFRSEALRAVYVDWKGGGQINFFPQFAEEWWFRWQTMEPAFRPDALPKFEALGIRYVVLQPRFRLARLPLFENGRYVVYSTADKP